MCWCAGAPVGADVNHARSPARWIWTEFAGTAVLHLRRRVHMENFRLLATQTGCSGWTSACHVLTRYIISRTNHLQTQTSCCFHTCRLVLLLLLFYLEGKLPVIPDVTCTFKTSSSNDSGVLVWRLQLHSPGTEKFLMKCYSSLNVKFEGTGFGFHDNILVLSDWECSDLNLNKIYMENKDISL